jgi:hypothetical protein
MSPLGGDGPAVVKTQVQALEDVVDGHYCAQTELA